MLAAAAMTLLLVAVPAAADAKTYIGGPEPRDAGTRRDTVELPGSSPPGRRDAQRFHNTIRDMPVSGCDRQEFRFRSGLLTMPPAGLEPATRCLEGRADVHDGR